MYPANQTAAESFVVPVLPATCRLSSAIDWPVRPGMPPLTTPLSMYVTLSATSRLMTREQLPLGTGRGVPSRSRMSRITTGSQWMPCAAKVA